MSGETVELMHESPDAEREAMLSGDAFDRAETILTEACADDTTVRRVAMLVAEHVLPIWEAGRPDDRMMRHAVNAMKFASTAPRIDSVISMLRDAAFSAGTQAYSFGVNPTERDCVLSRSAEVVMHAARACCTAGSASTFAKAAVLNAERAVSDNARLAVFAAAEPDLPRYEDFGIARNAVDALVAVVRRGLEPADGMAP